MKKQNFDLNKISTRAPGPRDKDETRGALAELLIALEELQYLLFAQGKHSLLVVLQGLDASGKDGIVRGVFGRVNPMGLRVASFKQPTQDELAHDFLWRIHKETPAKGMIHIFNRSHYEDVLVTRSLKIIDDKKAFERMEAINAFEKILEQSGTQVLKFYLHISQEEQAKRFKERLQDPRKNWKYNPNDLHVSAQWGEYQKYYADVFEHCGPDIPWHIIPADQKWYRDYLVAEAVVRTLSDLEMKYPKLKTE